ncbi:hypothetical protein NDU88_006592 [Pleurodeles waltl]|uniref:Uncharacterized protein n=1 Tax=Pleurodeles waltl TaxID=8319 RepID=A0AAV7SQ24_PLEWA|nr:hypothetical protein NDU88_006592 [Pleurodeles waltl]
MARGTESKEHYTPRPVPIVMKEQLRRELSKLSEQVFFRFCSACRAMVIPACWRVEQNQTGKEKRSAEEAAAVAVSPSRSYFK